MLRHALVFSTLFVVVGSLARAEDPVFSGPQIDEKLPPFKVTSVVGEENGKDIDLVSKADGKPIVLFFLHERTRPAFGLIRAVSKYAVQKSEDGLHSGVIILSADATKDQQWARGVLRHFPENLNVCVSPDGKEGPGAYGLNRNVTLTVLVGKEGKVTENFALVQPQLQADGPKILKAIAEVVGDKKVPSVADLEGARYAGQAENPRMRRAADNNSGRAAGRGDPQLTNLLRGVINKQADADAIKEAAAEVEAYVEKNEAARKDLIRIVTTVVGSDRFDTYGTETSREVLKGWYEAFTKDDNKDQEADKKEETSKN